MIDGHRYLEGVDRDRPPMIEGLQTRPARSQSSAQASVFGLRDYVGVLRTYLFGTGQAISTADNLYRFPYPGGASGYTGMCN